MISASRSRFERVYSAVVLVKGLDGLVELTIGVTLLVAPAAARHVLALVAGELGEGVASWQRSLADAVADTGEGLSSGAVALAAFFAVHGIVKLATVYCLVRRLVRLYPWALAVLAVLFAVQLVSAITAPTIGAWVLATLDVVVIVLVAWEYRRLLRDVAEPRVASRARIDTKHSAHSNEKSPDPHPRGSDRRKGT